MTAGLCHPSTKSPPQMLVSASLSVTTSTDDDSLACQAELMVFSSVQSGSRVLGPYQLLCGTVVLR